MENENLKKNFNNLPINYKIVPNNFYSKTIYNGTDIAVCMTSKVGRFLTWEIIPKHRGVTHSSIDLFLCKRIFDLGSKIVNMISNIAVVTNGYIELAESKVIPQTHCIELSLLTDLSFKKIQKWFSVAKENTKIFKTSQSDVENINLGNIDTKSILNFGGSHQKAEIADERINKSIQYNIIRKTNKRQSALNGDVDSNDLIELGDVQMCKRYYNCRYRIGIDENSCNYCPTNYKINSSFIVWQRKQMR